MWNAWPATGKWVHLEVTVHKHIDLDLDMVLFHLLCSRPEVKMTILKLCFHVDSVNTLSVCFQYVEQIYRGSSNNRRARTVLLMHLNLIYSCILAWTVCGRQSQISLFAHWCDTTCLSLFQSKYVNSWWRFQVLIPVMSASESWYLTEPVLLVTLPWYTLHFSHTETGCQLSIMICSR